MLYSFADYVLDLSLYQLRHRDVVIPLEPKVFDVLRYLVENHERVATKKELLDSLWPNEAVTEAVLPTNINSLRRALGQRRGERAPIETVHGRGYRFSSPVVRLADARADSLPAGARLSLVEDLSSEDEQDLLVGHDQLARKLRRCLLKSLHGQGQVCILRGEAGIGKSRIARHICDLAKTRGADVWVSACPDGVGTPPLWIWQDVLRSAKASEGATALRHYLGKASESSSWLRALLEERTLTEHEVNERERFGLYDCLVRLLSGASRTRPRIVWLEDMHRADEGSWQLLRLLAPHLETSAVLVLCTVRSQDDLTTALPVQRNVDHLARLPFCHRFQVGTLEESETQELAEKLFGHPVTAELSHTIHVKTGGNPLFVSELVEWLVGHGKTGQDAFPTTPNLAPPDLVRHVVARRVERLGESATRVLEACAVIGANFESSLVAAVSELSPDAVSEALDRACEKRVIAASDEGVEAFDFTHELARDTLYANLSSRDRRKLHARTAQQLELWGADTDPETLCAVASHYYHALPDGDAQTALGWLSRAAAACEQVASFDAALRFYRFAHNALRLLPEADVELREQLTRAVDRTRAKARHQARASAELSETR